MTLRHMFQDLISLKLQRVQGNFFLLLLLQQWVVSSVGLEHYLDRVGVTGSNPVQPTLQVIFSCLFFLVTGPDVPDPRVRKSGC